MSVDHGNDINQEDELGNLRKENTKLLNELASVYQQFLLLKEETEISYAQLRDRNQELEKKVDELERANAELEETENQLIHSERLAAMGQLGASIVHELSSPLTVISGYIEMLLMRGSLDEEDQRLLKVARQHTDSMTHLVRDILSFSHKQATPFDIVDVNEIVENVVVFLGNLLEKHRFKIEKLLGENIQHIIGSPQQIQQVFINLITNASDAIQNEGALVIKTSELTSESVRELTAGEHIISARLPADLETFFEKYDRFISIRFQDNGPGIPQDTMMNIFTPFFTTKPVGKGTGLGLSICRTIIERHDGNILVSSIVGQGTTFTLILPVRDAKEQLQINEDMLLSE